MLLWDRLGIGISAVCTIHCLLFPALVAILPLWPAASHLYEWTHPVFIALLVPTVWFAARRSHFNKRVTRLLVSGLLLVVFGWLLGHLWLGFLIEILLTVAGSGFMIIGHILNYRHHRTCNNSQHNHHPVDS